MSYADQWRAIAARIDGLARAAELLSQFLMSSSQEPYKSYWELGKGCQSALALIEQFAADFGPVLPKAAADRIADFITDKRRGLFNGAGSDMNMMKAAVVMLLNLRAELDYLLSDQQENIRSRTERAFLHLQRLLAVDEDTRRKWLAAFAGSGEIGCEQLGAVHLLMHGIFAFKVDAKGARTDLVFGEPRDDFGSRGIEGLVLTEWKVGDDASASSRFEQARSQMTLYQRGALTALELTGFRYAIVVSQDDLQIAVPEDLDQSGVIYRHINIVLDPLTPSRAAAKKKI